MSDYKITVGTELTGAEKLDAFEKKLNNLKTEKINVDVKLTVDSKNIASDVTKQLNRQLGGKLEIDADIDINPILDNGEISKTISQAKNMINASMKGAAKFKPILDESYLNKLASNIDTRLSKIGSMSLSKKYNKNAISGELEFLKRDLGAWDAIMDEIDPSLLPAKVRHSLALTQQSIDDFFDSFDNKKLDINIDEQIREEAQRVKAEIKSIEKFMDKYNRGGVFADLDKISDRYDKLGGDSLQNLRGFKRELDGFRASGFNDALDDFHRSGDQRAFAENIKHYKDTFATLKNGLDSIEVSQKKIKRNSKEIASANKLANSKKTFGLQIDKWLNDNSAAAEQFGTKLQNIKSRIDSCNNDASLGRLKSEFQQVKLEADLAGKSTKTFGDRIKEQISQYGTYAIVAAGLAATAQTFTAMAKDVLEVDTAMTGLYRVTDLTSQQYDKLYSNMISSAKEYGATLTDTINATSDWVRAGFDANTALELADITAMYQHISDLDYAEASKNLLTSYNGFKETFNQDFGGDVSASVMHVTDVLNELDNKFSVTSAGLGEGLARSASALQMAGNTFEQSAAMIGATAEVQQDPEKAGQAMKILSLRLRGMKGELEELGEEADGVENISKMQGQILNMTKGKVNIFGDSGEFRSTYDIMKDIASIYDELSSTDQANLLETIAGKNRANDVAALIENFDTAIQMAETAENSAGSAARENAKYVDSMQGRLDIMTASLQALSNTAMNSDFLKGGISTITAVIDGITKLIETFGAIPTVAGAAATGFAIFNKGLIRIDKGASGVINKFTLFGKNLSQIKDIFTSFRLFGQDGGFNLMANDGKGSPFKGFADRLQNDRKIFASYTKAMKNGQVEIADAKLKRGSSFLSDYINDVPEAEQSLADFTRRQQEAFVALQASNKGLKSSVGIISEYNNKCKNVGMTQQNFASVVGSSNQGLGKYLTGLNGAKASMSGYVTSLVASKAATIGLTVASTALNAMLTMGIGVAIGFVINKIDEWIVTEEELAEKVADVTTKYNDQKESLKNAQSTISDVADQYERLSKGVNVKTNENIDLNPDEYEEYLGIVNQIGDTFPELISGYDEQGNAILSCAGSVEKLNEAYDNLAKKANNELLDNADDIAKDAKNKSEDVFSDKWKQGTSVEANLHAYDTLEKLTKSKNLKKSINNMGADDLVILTDVLNNYGEEWNSHEESRQQFINRVLTENKETVNKVLSDTKASMQAAASGMQDIAEATIGNAFIDGGYDNISDEMQNYIKGMVPNMDYEFFDSLGWDDEKLKESINNTLSTLNSLDNHDQKKFDIMFDMESKLNSDECTVGEYIKSINDVESVLDKSGLDEHTQKQLKMSLGIDDNQVVKDVDAFKKKLETAGMEGADKFVDNLTATELKAAVNLDLDFKGMDAADIKAAIEKEAKYLEAMSYTIDIESEMGGIDALNSALAESRSATGLTIESMDALKGRYKELGTYDAATLFEETANGISLNAEAVNEYEQALADTKLDETTGHLDTLKNKYDELTNDIANCTDAAEKSKLINEREDVRKHITELAELATAYDGLTSSYAEWQRAESAGNDRDLYSNVHSAMEGISKELKNGWIDDGTKEYFQLIWGEDKWDGAGKSIQDYRDKWATLDDTIQGTSYSIQDFFKTNKDGELTSEGIFNFFDAVDQVEDKIGRDVIKKDDNGNIASFDFGVDGDKAIADALGISEELVQIFLRASRDAGFVVNFDGTYTQLANLQNEAMAAQDKYNEIFGKEYSFNFNTQSLKEAQEDLKEAKKLLEDEDFWNHDANGKRTTFNFDAKGAKEAMQMVSTLQAMVDNLDNKYIGITVEDKQFEEPLEKAQDYEAKVDELNQLELNPEANTADIDTLKEDISEIINYFAELDDKTKKKLNIPVDLEGEALDNKIKEMLDNGTLEIPTTLDIQTNISESIEDLRDIAMLNSGLLSDKEEAEIELKFKLRSNNKDIEEQVNEILKNSGITDNKEIEIGTKFFADTQDILDYKPEQIEAVVKFVKDIDDIENYTPEDKQAIAEFVKDVEDVENYTPEQKEAIAKYVKDIVDIESYTPENKKAICDFIVNNEDVMAYTPEEKAAIAKYLADPQDVDAYEPADKAAITKFLAEHGDVDAYNPSDKQALATFLLNNALVEGYQPTDKDLDVIAEVDKSDVDSYQPPSKTMTIWATVKKAESDLWGLVTGGSVDGTAHINGTAYVNGSTGRAFKKGSWDTKDSGTALMGELGQETIVRDGRFFTVGDNGAEFVKYRKGDIIFNHKQTEELFKNGYVTSGGGRGRAYAEGTAFSRGTGAANPWNKPSGGYSYNVSSGSSKSTKSPSPAKEASEEAEKFEEVLDWIEVAIDRIERAINNLDTVASSTFRSWTERTSALNEQIAQTRNEIDLQQRAYDRYMKAANEVGLDAGWAQKVRDGKVDIELITDENLKEKVDQYQDWYEKALNCRDAVIELTEKESELYKQRFDNVSAKFEGYLGVIEHEKNMLDEFIAQSEAHGWITSQKYYEALAQNTNNRISELKKQRDEMTAEMNAAVDSGKISKGSEAWYEMVNEIDSVTLELEKANTELLEFQNNIRDIDYQIFELIQDRISDITEEADFLIELMSNKKLYDDKGQLTDEGQATMGLHGVNYNTYMAQADKYKQKVDELNAQITKDPHNQNLIDKRDEYLEAQRESILAAEDEKNAIRDMVEEGISLELDALQELIDKRNEALDNAKDLYDYQKKIAEQTKEIADLEKQLGAYAGDDSEETKATIQELKVQLEEARQNLEESEYDQYLSDQQALLDSLYLEYETILNARLDNIDALVMQQIEYINQNAANIQGTITEQATAVGAQLSAEMQNIWDTGNVNTNGDKIHNVIEFYGKDFGSKLTTVNTTIQGITAKVQDMVNKLDAIAAQKTQQAQNSSASKPSGGSSSSNSKPSNPSPAPAKPKADAYGIAGSIWVLGGGPSGWGNNPVRAGKLTKAYGADFARQVQSIINNTFATGKWDRKRDYSAYTSYKLLGYKDGKHKLGQDEYAWTQENGAEMIVRPSDGAILTPLAKNDSVLTSAASRNIWDMANNPTDFIKNNLGVDMGNVPNGNGSNNSYVQNIDNVVFSMPNVKNYDQMIRTMQKDKNFERLVNAMTIDQLAGGSKLAKGKAIK